MVKNGELRCDNCRKLLGRFDENGDLEIVKPKGVVKFKKNGENEIECYCGKKNKIKIWDSWSPGR